MRQLFILDATNDIDAQGQTYASNFEEAQEIASWATEIIEVDGGWHAFESYEDYLIFCNQL